MLRKSIIVATLAAAAIVFAGAATAQQLPAAANQSPTIKRTPLQKFDVAGSNYETVIGTAEIVPNVNIGRHTHFGIESGYVLQGDLTLLVDGQPPKPLKVGDSYQIAAGAIHDAKSGAAGAKVIATYVVEKGKPFATPAP
jgi:quercetin dioxygenase-like cupin family protein